MNKSTITILIAALVSGMLLVTAGCESDAQTGAGIGAAAGAGIGQVAGRDTESTLIGGAVGGGVGYIIGTISTTDVQCFDSETIGAQLFNQH